MRKNKPRWKNLPTYERMARRCKQSGVSDEMCDWIRTFPERKRQREQSAANAQSVS